MEAGTFQDNHNFKLYIYIQYVLQQVSGKKDSSQCVSINRFLLIENYMDMGQNPFLPVTVPNMNKLV